jgi:hypothetical protein
MSRLYLPPHVARPDTWLADDLFRALEQFERVLQGRCRIQLVQGTSINEAFRHLLDLISAFRREYEADPDHDFREELRVALGLADLAKKTAMVEEHPDFDQLCPHFGLLLREASLVQTVPSLVDATSDKVFELLVALSVMQFGVNVRVDHPEASVGDNPDVLALVRGATWGFACKAANTPNLSTYAERVAGAVDQIERSPADHGVVVVSLKNLLAYDQMWSFHGQGRFTCWPSAEVADRALEAHVGDLLAEWEERFGGPDTLRDLFDGRKASPVILNYVNATLLVEREGRPVLTTLRRIVPLALGVRDDPHVWPVLEALSRGAAPVNAVLPDCSPP